VDADGVSSQQSVICVLFTFASIPVERGPGVILC